MKHLLHTAAAMQSSAVPPATTRLLSEQMLRRQAELRSMLQAANDAAMGTEGPGDVTDFKDVAAEDTRALIDEAAHAHAAGELAQIDMALRRVGAGTYGECEDCGEPIDERRLQTLPATAFCTACQAIHERPAPGRSRTPVRPA